MSSLPDITEHLYLNNSPYRSWSKEFRPAIESLKGEEFESDEDFERKSIAIYTIGSKKFSIRLLVTNMRNSQRLPYWKLLRPLFRVCAQWFFSGLRNLFDRWIVVDDRFHVLTSTASLIYVIIEIYNNL